jgi:hypothetical protein
MMRDTDSTLQFALCGKLVLRIALRRARFGDVWTLHVLLGLAIARATRERRPDITVRRGEVWAKFRGSNGRGGDG